MTPNIAIQTVNRARNFFYLTVPRIKRKVLYLFKLAVDDQLGPSWLLSTANTLRDDNQDVVLPLPHGGQQPPERVGPRKIELSEEKAGESSTSLCYISLFSGC